MFWVSVKFVLRGSESSSLRELVMAVVARKCLERRSYNLKAPSSDPLGAKVFFSSSINGRVSLIRALKRGGSLFFFLFPIKLFCLGQSRLK